ncbi:MAG: hypothetical protein GX044_11135 [Firmicutes bacterium]|jgi:hypothetical protein|nr:hypothetical protein [Bacillota bacterium]
MTAKGVKKLVNQESNQGNSDGNLCPYCEYELAAEANFCRQCGRELPPAESAITAGDAPPAESAITASEAPPAVSATTYTTRPEAVPNDYLAWAILATILCCIPFGVVAIVYAAQVNSLVAAGNYAAAWKASQNAKKWCLVSLFTGIAVYILYFLAVFISVGWPFA